MVFEPQSPNRGETLAYKAPTLDEIYAEIFYEPGSIVPADFFTIVPQLTASGFSEVEFAETGIRLSIDPSAEEKIVPQRKPRVRCWLEDRSAVSQVVEDQIAVNLIGSYPGWERFKELFVSVRESVQTGLPKARPVSLNLATIDRFEVTPTSGLSLSDYLQTGGRFIPQWYSNVDSNADISLGQGFLKKDGFNRQIALRVRFENASVSFQLRASFHNQLCDRPLDGLLEELHSESNQTFESIITDRVRTKIMGGQV